MHSPLGLKHAAALGGVADHEPCEQAGPPHPLLRGGATSSANVTSSTLSIIYLYSSTSISITVGATAGASVSSHPPLLLAPPCPVLYQDK
jgi:hypothetical protein